MEITNWEPPYNFSEEWFSLYALKTKYQKKFDLVTTFNALNFSCFTILEAHASLVLALSVTPSSVCLLSSVTLFQILHFVQFSQVLSDFFKSLQVLSGPFTSFKLFQVVSSRFKSFHVLPSPFKSFWVLWSPSKYFQIISTPFNFYQVLSYPSKSFQVLLSPS